MQSLGIFRGVVKSVRQITTYDENTKRISSNLELAFKAISKKSVNEKGEVVWADSAIPAIKKDGTTYESKSLPLSNRCLVDIDIMADTKLSKEAKKTFIKLFAKTPNPMKVYANIGELYAYLLKDRGIEFERTLFAVGEKISTDNGTTFEVANSNVIQTHVNMVVGNILPIYDECITEWAAEEHPTKEQQPTPAQPTQPAENDVQAMWANV